MNYNPNEVSSPLPNGDYDFEVASAEDRRGKDGGEQIKVQMVFFGPQGRKTTVFEYLTPKAVWKIQQFCDSIGIGDVFDTGKLTARHIKPGVGGRATLSIQTDKTGQYPDKNTVAKYLNGTAAPAKPTSDEAENEFADLGIEETEILE